MPIALSTNRIKFKNSNNDYISVDAIADSTTADRINLINQTKDAALVSINNKKEEAQASFSNSTEIQNMIANFFDDSLNYTAGQYVIKATTSGNTSVNELYKFIIDHPAGTWNNNDVVKVKTNSEITNFKNVITNYEKYGVAIVDATSYLVPWTEGKYLDDNGNEQTNTNTHYSNYIPVSSGIMLLVYEGNLTSIVTRVHAYNSQKEYIKKLKTAAASSGINRLTIDTENAAYIRISMAKLNTVEYIGGYITDKNNVCYVSTTGNDSNSGTQNSPFLTINKGLQMGYKTIYVKPGNYSERVVIDHLNGIKIVPYGFLDFSTIVPDTPMIVLDGGENLTITNGLSIINSTDITIENIHCKNTSSYPIYIEDCNGLNMKYCKASDSLNAGFYIGDTFGTFEACEAYNLGDENSQYCDGFGIHGYGDTTFINCSGHDNQDDGISHHYGCTGTVIGGEWYNNGKGGVCTPTHGARVNIFDVYCHDNAYGIFILAENPGRTTKAIVSNCVMKNNSEKDFDIRGGSVVVSYNNSYDTINVSQTSTFTELPFMVDNGLTKTGVPADAKATSDKIDTIGALICKESGTTTKKYAIHNGHSYYIKNNNNNTLNVNYAYASGTPIAVLAQLGNKVSGIYTANRDCEYVTASISGGGTVDFELVDMSTVYATIKMQDSAAFVSSLPLVQGSIYTGDGTNITNNNRVRSEGYISGTHEIIMPEGYIVHGIYYYDAATKAFDSYRSVGYRAFNFGKDDKVARVVFAKTDTSASVTPEEIKQIPNGIDTTLVKSGLAADAKATGNEINSIKNLTGGMLDVSITTTTNFPFEFVKGRQYCIYNVTGKNISVNARKTNDGENTTIHSNLAEGRCVVWTATDDFHFIRLYSVNGTARIIAYDVTSIAGKAAYDVSNREFGNYVRFNYGYDLKDVSDIVEEVDYGTGHDPIIEQVYDLFDDLVMNHPSYVTRYDAAEYTDMTYPEYANGIDTEGTYLVTPAYKAYMYRFNESNTSLSNDHWCPKRKMIIFGGVHGDEDAAPFNLYIFANLLCNGVMSDSDLFKLRAAYDIYIVPCVNGYGMYHRTRANANKVNINRNFPVLYWQVSGADTMDRPINQYSGPTAGSEFETQLMINLMNMIVPDVVIDHHNYARTHQQYYTECFDQRLKNICYQSLVDCSIAFKKAYPQYFGSGYGMVCNTTDGSPAIFRDGVYGTFPTWAGENGIPCAATVEIGRGIYYDNGEYAASEINMYGSDTFSIAEYTLQLQLLKFAEYSMTRFAQTDVR